MGEEWRVIKEFPTYQINDQGDVVNRDTGRHIRPSLTRAGIVKVGLVSGGVQYTRSVKVLVGEAFVGGRSELFDTPLQLDGDHGNVSAENLTWRPRWFAWKYVRQFSEITPHHSRGPIVDEETGLTYEDIFTAARVHGLLVTDVWRSIIHRKPVFPTQQMFSFLK